MKIETLEKFVRESNTTRNNENKRNK